MVLTELDRLSFGNVLWEGNLPCSGIKCSFRGNC